jgi:hypothetical protein
VEADSEVEEEERQLQLVEEVGPPVKEEEADEQYLVALLLVYHNRHLVDEVAHRLLVAASEVVKYPDLKENLVHADSKERKFANNLSE